MWESHSEQKGSGSGADLDQDPLGRSGDYRECGSLQSDSLEPIEYPVVDSRVPVPVANVIQSEVVTQWKEGNGCSQIAPPEYHILTGCTTVTDCSGGSAGGSKGASGSPSVVPEVGSAE